MDQTFPWGSDQPIPSCPLIEVSGTPRERGRQYGEQAKARILRGIAHYSTQLEGSQLGWPEIGTLLRQTPPAWRRAVLLSLAFEEDFAVLDATIRKMAETMHGEGEV